MFFFVFVLKTLMSNVSKVCSFGGCRHFMACCTTLFWIVTDAQSKWSTDWVATSSLGYISQIEGFVYYVSNNHKRMILYFL